ncbi:tRNA 2-thiouridine(34) synthase MnmA [Adlercreutzia faecimuris]|uniref:tRNA-specific 2-thiouridylase MnmA n=1 Tax=Adlercreutzia faecimuris TaxID=2897341 RepID=A0ABS9WFG3_9ACTN|nr:tRNA 2-thiouridine(34) synthase MnmA [Adlercreutzia sp. JBNU-10]MCI2241601.1 tRNA 2-thiouridine(34) synthase MnmA [Adlercreutzia sp. JBNU-10]
MPGSQTTDAPRGRVALGMSGGVDSSVAVAALAAEGYEVVGVTLVLRDAPDARDAARAAAKVCARLGAEHRVVEAAAAFDAAVVAPFAAAYGAGLTPSPCVGCNAAAKLPLLLAAADEAGCAHVATGHYARVGALADGRYAVLAGLDHGKDQSYMLAALTQGQLARLVLPLGGMTKLAVRAAAAEMGLACADAPESQDICFAPAGYRALLAERGVRAEPGPILTRDGREVGRHTGLSDYTVGQRKGIGVAGPEPYYVLEKRLADNALVVGPAAAAVMGRAEVGPVNWQAVAGLDAPADAMVKLRYRAPAVPCIIVPRVGGGATVRLREPQPLTAPGQWAVFYQGSTVLGGAVIEEVG